MRQQSLQVFDRLWHWWRTYWLLRWVVAHVIGWFGALLFMVLAIWLLGAIGAVSAGALIGFGLSVPQAWILFSDDEHTLRRDWVLYTTIASFFASFPSLFLVLVGFFNVWLSAVLIGSVVGALLGFAQAQVLEQVLDDRAYWWILVVMGASIMTALVTILVLYSPIPLILSPATIVFALITGNVLMSWMSDID